MILFIGVPFLICMLFYILKKKASVLSVFLSFTIAFNYLGLLYLDLNNYQTITYQNLIFRKDLFVTVFFVNTVVICMIIFTYEAFSLVLKKKNNLTKSKYAITVDPLLDIKLIKYSIILSLFSLGYILWTKGFYNLPLIAAIKGANITELIVLRNDFTNNTPYYTLLSFFRKDLLILALSLCSIYIAKNNDRRFLLLSIWVTVLLIFNLMLSGEKAPVIDLLVVLVLVSLLVGSNRLKLARIGAYLAIGSGFVMIGYILFLPAKNIALLVSGLFERLMIGQIIPATYYLEIFPKFHNFLYGLSFPNIGGIFSYSPVEITSLVMDFSGYNRSVDGLGVKGTMPTIFWAELYANFGRLGIVIGTIIVGCSFSLLDRWRNLKSTNISLAIFIYLTLILKDLSITGMFDFIINFRIYLIFILYYVIKNSFHKVSQEHV